MTRALRFTLLGLAVIVVLFAVTYVSAPSGASRDVAAPPSWFMRGLGVPVYGCLRYGTDLNLPGGKNCIVVGDVLVGRAITAADARALKTRIVIFFACLAAVVILVGLAFGAGRRSPTA